MLRSKPLWRNYKVSDEEEEEETCQPQEVEQRRDNQSFATTGLDEETENGGSEISQNGGNGLLERFD